MLDGVTPFPAEFAARYRALGYWEDRPLFDGFTAALAAYADRVAVVDETGPVTYRQLDERSERLARALLDCGLEPLDRVIVQLPNTALFAYLYFALLRIGAAPVLALPGHRRREITQFAGISAAQALAVPAAARGFDFAAMAADVMTDRPDLRLCLIQGLTEAPNDPRFVRLEDLLSREPRSSREALEQISIDPSDPALFLLSGGTTGIPKLIPRTHNDYLYNSKIAAAACEIGVGDVLLDVLPIEHNLPLGCPGLQGFLLSGGTVVLGTSTRPRDVFELIQRHRVTHIHLVPALLIRWIDDPGINSYDLSSLRVIQSGGQRLQPEVRLRAERALPGCFVQENFGMAEGLIMFVRSSDPPQVRRETCGRPASPADEVYLVDEDGHVVPDGEPGELIVRGPLKGPAAVAEATAAVRDHHVLGFHFHPIMGHFAVDDPALNPLFETIAGLGVPVMVDVGTTGMGAGLPGGLGARLEHARPLAIDNLAARFPALTIIAAHPGWPWTDEMTAVALHKGNVYWELSGWAPKYFPSSLRTDIRGRLREKIMFGSDHPSLPYERILREWDELGYDQSVMDLVFHANAERVLGL